MSDSTFISARDAAALAGVDSVTLWRLCRRGAFPTSIGWGRREQILRAPFLAYLAKCEATARRAVS